MTSVKLCFENYIPNICHLTPQAHPGHGRPPKVWIVYGLWIQLLLNQSQKCFWNCV